MTLNLVAKRVSRSVVPLPTSFLRISAISKIMAAPQKPVPLIDQESEVVNAEQFATDLDVLLDLKSMPPGDERILAAKVASVRWMPPNGSDAAASQVKKRSLS